MRVEAFAALGARLSAPDESFDDEVRGALDDVLAAAGLSNLEELSAEERRTLSAMVGSWFRQALSILDEATEPPGWRYTDPSILDGQGRAGTNIVPHIAAIIGDNLVRLFLDVGTGTGFLAIAAALRWPEAKIVGIDVWEPALERARRHVAEAGMGDRVEIRDQDVADLDEVDEYGYVGIPSMFMPAWILPVAVQRAMAAARPGGLVSVAVFQAEPMESVSSLRSTR